MVPGKLWPFGGRLGLILFGSHLGPLVASFIWNHERIVHLRIISPARFHTLCEGRGGGDTGGKEVGIGGTGGTVELVELVELVEFMEIM